MTMHDVDIQLSDVVVVIYHIEVVLDVFNGAFLCIRFGNGFFVTDH